MNAAAPVKRRLGKGGIMNAKGPKPGFPAAVGGSSIQDGKVSARCCMAGRVCMQSLQACCVLRRLMPPALAGMPVRVHACMHPSHLLPSSLRTSKLLPLSAVGPPMRPHAYTRLTPAA